MSDKPLVSLLIPICNVEKYLRECLDSARDQTLKNIEIICINEPTFHPIGDLANVMRSDEEEAARSLDLPHALGNAASVSERYFRVPSILGEEGDR